MGGVKRKISIEKIERKDPRAVTFSKRRKGLYSKASELCLLSDAQIAIIATPVSSNSNFSFYSFGHSSVDSVVAAFLANQRPRDETLGFWWEDESFANSENTKELRDGIDSMSKMLQDLKELEKGRYCEDVKKEMCVSHVTHQTQTLDPQPCSATSVCIQDDVTVNVEGFHKNIEEQTLVVSDNGLLESFDEFNQELDLDQLYDFVKSEDLWKNLEMDNGSMDSGVSHVTHQPQTLNPQPCSATSVCIQDDVTVNVEGFHKNTEHQTIRVSDNSLLGSFDEFNQELDLDQIFDFETKSEDLWKNLEMGVSHVTHETQTLNPQPCSATSVCFQDDETVNVEGFQKNIEEQTLTVSDDNGLLESFDGFNQELDLDQLFDFVKESGDLWKNLEMGDGSMNYGDNESTPVTCL